MTSHLIDLEIGSTDEVLLVGASRYVREDVVERVGNHAAKILVRANALHRERLASARLTVGKYGAIEAVQHGLDERPKRLLVKVDLLRAEKNAQKSLNKIQQLRSRYCGVRGTYFQS